MARHVRLQPQRIINHTVITTVDESVPPRDGRSRPLTASLAMGAHPTEDNESGSVLLQVEFDYRRDRCSSLRRPLVNNVTAQRSEHNYVMRIGEYIIVPSPAYFITDHPGARSTHSRNITGKFTLRPEHAKEHTYRRNANTRHTQVELDREVL